MTQTNTTQNKEELSKEVKKFRERYEDFIGIKKGEYIFKIHSDYFDSIAPFWLEELSQAHQSGIEEERKRITKIITDKFLLTLDLNTWTADSVKTEALFNNSKEIKNWNKAMNKLLESLKENKQ